MTAEEINDVLKEIDVLLAAHFNNETYDAVEFKGSVVRVDFGGKWQDVMKKSIEDGLKCGVPRAFRRDWSIPGGLARPSGMLLTPSGIPVRVLSQLDVARHEMLHRFDLEWSI